MTTVWRSASKVSAMAVATRSGSRAPRSLSLRSTAANTHEIGFSFLYDGGGFGKGGLVTLHCDGAEVASERIERTTPFAFSVADKFHVGVNRGTPVTNDYPALDNNFCGDVAWVRIDTGDDATHESPERIAQTVMATD